MTGRFPEAASEIPDVAGLYLSDQLERPTAKLERDENSRRTKAGLERARAKGKKLGNAFLPADKVAKIEARHAEGKSIKAISREAGVAYGTAHKYVQKLKV